MYKAERDAYKFHSVQASNLTISTFQSMYKTERDKFKVYNFQFNKEHILEHVQSWKEKHLIGLL